MATVCHPGSGKVSNHWWRTLADEVTPEQAQAALDGFCATRGDARLRTLNGRRGSVATFIDAERLSPGCAGLKWPHLEPE